ncbi:hypothetical protein Aduo_017049 [Ancylostoma duodenale]
MASLVGDVSSLLDAFLSQTRDRKSSFESLCFLYFDVHQSIKVIRAKRRRRVVNSDASSFMVHLQGHFECSPIYNGGCYEANETNLCLLKSETTDNERFLQIRSPFWGSTALHVNLKKGEREGWATIFFID